MPNNVGYTAALAATLTVSLCPSSKLYWLGLGNPSLRFKSIACGLYIHANVVLRKIRVNEKSLESLRFRC